MCGAGAELGAETRSAGRRLCGPWDRRGLRWWHPDPHIDHGLISRVRMPPVDLIIDTDMSIDVDDVGALCVAHALTDAGEATIRAVTHDTANPYGASSISVINHFYGRDEIPIGAYRGPIGAPDLTPGPDWTNRGLGWYTPELSSRFPAPIRNASEARNAVDVLRNALASVTEDRSVTIVAVGHATNLVALLESYPDSISEMTGMALVQRAVRQLVWMGGSYWDSGRVEWNFGKPHHERPAPNQRIKQVHSQHLY